jgi:hypothetical protein
MELRSFDIDQMASISKEFSGAEIEQAIVEGMYRAFHEQRDVSTEDILGAIKETYPLASTAREQISFMQAWATQGRARSASRGEVIDITSDKLSDISVVDKATKALAEKSRGKHRPLPLPPLPQIKSSSDS